MEFHLSQVLQIIKQTVPDNLKLIVVEIRRNHFRVVFEQFTIECHYFIALNIEHQQLRKLLQIVSFNC